MSAVRVKYDVFPKTAVIPAELGPYWTDKLVLSEGTDFYKRGKIIQVSLKVFQDRHLELTYPHGEMTYTTHVSYVKIITACGRQFKVGLHLFPLLKFGRKELPSQMVIYAKNADEEKVALELPASVTVKFLQYLNQGRPNLRFTCAQFADFINGVYNEKNNAFLYKYDLVACDPDNLSPGDTVLFKDEKNEPIHVAIYLGRDIFLWHSSNRCLRVSSFLQIMTCYSARAMFRAVLKTPMPIL